MAKKSGSKKSSKKGAKRVKHLTPQQKAARTRKRNANAKAAAAASKPKTRKPKTRKASAKPAAHASSKRASKSGSPKKGRKSNPRVQIVRAPIQSVKVVKVPVVMKPGRATISTRSKSRKKKSDSKKSKSSKKAGVRVARERYAMENPLGGLELFVGGLTLLVGIATEDVVDRFLATHALTDTKTKDGNGIEIYADDKPATDGAYKGMTNGAAILAPMDWKRWLAGGALFAVPVIGAHFIKAPVGRSALQFFGFGVLARFGGKAIADGVAYLTRNTGVGKRLYNTEVHAQAYKKSITGDSAAVMNYQALQQALPIGLGFAPPRLRPGVGEPDDCGCNGSQHAHHGRPMTPPPPPVNAAPPRRIIDEPTTVPATRSQITAPTDNVVNFRTYGANDTRRSAAR